MNMECLWSKYRRKGISDVSIKALVVVMLKSSVYAVVERFWQAEMSGEAEKNIES